MRFQRMTDKFKGADKKKRDFYGILQENYKRLTKNFR